MSGTVVVDSKGRVVLPKKIREQADITVNTRLVARVKGKGKIELINPDILMLKAQEIGAKKLAGWREEDHEATKLLTKLVRAHDKAD